MKWVEYERELSWGVVGGVDGGSDRFSWLEKGRAGMWIW